MVQKRNENHKFQRIIAPITATPYFVTSTARSLTLCISKIWASMEVFRLYSESLFFRHVRLPSLILIVDRAAQEVARRANKSRRARELQPQLHREYLLALIAVTEVLTKT